VVSLLANYWAEHGSTITVITVTGVGDDFYKLHPTIKRVGLDLASFSRSPVHAALRNFVRARRLRSALRESGATAILSFVERTNVIASLASVGVGKQLVVAERTDPREHRIGLLWRLLRRLAYRIADHVVVQTPAVEEWAKQWLPARKVHVIPNPVHSNELSPARPAEKRIPEIMAMGRFTFEKGFDLLLRGFASVAKDFPGWRLTLVGEGPLRGSLKELSADLGVAERVFMPGNVPNPERLLAEAAIFVLPSRFEGFPNALLEAMANGCAVIAADCPSGPRYIVRDGENGLLAATENADSLASAMARLMADTTLRAHLGERAICVREDFALTRIVTLWEQILR
jgi:glycosyltransferase involved in cell wall biosynthesis